MTTDIPNDVFEGFIDEEELYTIEYLGCLSILKLNKEKELLIDIIKKKKLTELQDKKYIELDKELEKYDDDFGTATIQRDAKRLQRKLYRDACITKNKKNLKIIETNYEELIKKIDKEHKEKINAYMNEKQKCECGLDISRANIPRHKKTDLHFETLKNGIKEKKELTEEDKKEKYNLYMKELQICECGLNISRANMPRHKKTDLHLETLKNGIKENEQLTEEDKKRNYCDYMNTKIKCECGLEISRSNMSKHKKTKNHLDNCK